MLRVVVSLTVSNPLKLDLSLFTSWRFELCVSLVPQSALLAIQDAFWVISVRNIWRFQLKICCLKRVKKIIGVNYEMQQTQHSKLY